MVAVLAQVRCPGSEIEMALTAWAMCNSVCEMSGNNMKSSQAALPGSFWGEKHGCIRCKSKSNGSGWVLRL